jgi:hypothetical protein
MNIRTNNVPRQLLYLCDFNATDQDKIRKQYDWMESEDLEYNFGFFKYRNCYYHLQDFMRASSDATGDLCAWDGYSSDSFFSGVVIKLCDDNESVVVGTYFA